MTNLGRLHFWGSPGIDLIPKASNVQCDFGTQLHHERVANFTVFVGALSTGRSRLSP